MQLVHKCSVKENSLEHFPKEKCISFAQNAFEHFEHKTDATIEKQ